MLLHDYQISLRSSLSNLDKKMRNMVGAALD